MTVSAAPSDRTDAGIPIHRSGVYLSPDQSRMLLRPFIPGGDERVRHVIDLVLRQSPATVASCLEELRERFKDHPVDLDALFAARARQFRHLLPEDAEPSPAQAGLIGAYLTNQYSLESAALFNPSIVPHPDQTGVPEGSLRFVMSLRATGEGHISSIEFRSGLIGPAGGIAVDAASGAVLTPEIRFPRHRKTELIRNLREQQVDDLLIETALAHLPEEFEVEELETSLRDTGQWRCTAEQRASEREKRHLMFRSSVRWVTQCDYRLAFAPSVEMSERVIFPVAPSESNGIEDARFVRFREDDGSSRYYGTYTAYDGVRITPHLIETEDFLSFRLCPFGGHAARNKGMALFPRRVRGRYAMLGRQGGMNVSLMFSDNLRRWDDYEVLLQPEAPWELIQLGNCGSPIETEEGWLVITHGVGAMRTYCIGAALLDLDDPRRVIGRLREPLMEPLPEERHGYVPNVVYSCGSLVHDGWLILPYAVSDYATSTAAVPLQPLLDRLLDR